MPDGIEASPIGMRTARSRSVPLAIQIAPAAINTSPFSSRPVMFAFRFTPVRRAEERKGVARLDRGRRSRTRLQGTDSRGDHLFPRDEASAREQTRQTGWSLVARRN